MRQEHKLTSKKMIALLSFLGLIPFYFELFEYLFHFNIQYNGQLRFENFSFIYGGFIISFLSGMNWQKLIYKEYVNFLYLPMLPVIFVWLSIFLVTETYFKVIIMIGLIWCLIIDLVILRPFNQIWFLKLRTIVTFLAIAPLFVIFFV